MADNADEIIRALTTLVSAILAADRCPSLTELVSTAVRVITAGDGRGEHVNEILAAAVQKPEPYWTVSDDLTELIRLAKDLSSIVDALIEKPAALSAFVRMFARAVRPLLAEAVFKIGFSDTAGRILCCSDEAWAVLDAAGWRLTRAEYLSGVRYSAPLCWAFASSVKFSRAAARLALDREEIKPFLAELLSAENLEVLEHLRDKYHFSWADFTNGRNLARLLQSDPNLFGFFCSIGAPPDLLVAKSAGALEHFSNRTNASLDSARLSELVCALDAADFLAKIPRNSLIAAVRSLSSRQYRQKIPIARILDVLAPDSPKEVLKLVQRAFTCASWTQILYGCVDDAELTREMLQLVQFCVDTAALNDRVLARALARATDTVAHAEQFAALVLHAAAGQDSAALENIVKPDLVIPSRQAEIVAIARLPPAAFAAVAAQLARADKELRAIVLAACFAENLDNAQELCRMLEPQMNYWQLLENPSVFAAFSANPAAARAVFAPTSSWPQNLCLAASANTLVYLLERQTGYALVDNVAARATVVFGRLALEHAKAGTVDEFREDTVSWCRWGLSTAILATRGEPGAAELAAGAFARTGAASRRRFWDSPAFAGMVVAAGSVAVEIALEHGLKSALDGAARALRRLLCAALESGRDDSFAALEAAGVDVKAGLAAHARTLKAFAVSMTRAGFAIEPRLQARLAGAGVLEQPA